MTRQLRLIDVPLFASYVARLAWRHRHSSWIVTEHQLAIARVLSEQGSQHSGSYAVMARAVVRPLHEIALAAATA
jgi:hypothetical protein